MPARCAAADPTASDENQALVQEPAVTRHQRADTEQELGRAEARLTAASDELDAVVAEATTAQGVTLPAGAAAVLHGFRTASDAYRQA